MEVLTVAGLMASVLGVTIAFANSKFQKMLLVAAAMNLAGVYLLVYLEAPEKAGALLPMLTVMFGGAIWTVFRYATLAEKLAIEKQQTAPMPIGTPTVQPARAKKKSSKR